MGLITVPAIANIVLAHLYPKARNILSAKRGNIVAIKLRHRLCPANAEDAYIP